jgi:hypothetical protein
VISGPLPANTGPIVVFPNYFSGKKVESGLAKKNPLPSKLSYLKKKIGSNLSSWIPFPPLDRMVISIILYDFIS